MLDILSSNSSQNKAANPTMINPKTSITLNIPDDDLEDLFLDSKNVLFPDNVSTSFVFAPNGCDATSNISL